MLLLLEIVFWFTNELLFFVLNLPHFFVVVYGRGQVVVNISMMT